MLKTYRSDDALQFESGFVEQRGVFAFGALASAGYRQHNKVEKLAVVRLTIGRNDRFG
jgi:hypothetical protein